VSKAHARPSRSRCPAQFHTIALTGLSKASRKSIGNPSKFSLWSGRHAWSSLEVILDTPRSKFSLTVPLFNAGL
jgi:hypothetical protein